MYNTVQWMHCYLPTYIAFYSAWSNTFLSFRAKIFTLLHNVCTVVVVVVIYYTYALDDFYIFHIYNLNYYSTCVLLFAATSLHYLKKMGSSRLVCILYRETFKYVVALEVALESYKLRSQLNYKENILQRIINGLRTLCSSPSLLPSSWLLSILFINISLLSSSDRFSFATVGSIRFPLS